MRQRTNAVSKLSEAQLSDVRVETAIRAASDKKATNIVLLDLQEIASFTDYFVICSGTSNRQVQAITDEIRERLNSLGASVAHIEGYQTAEWVLIDYGDFIVHIFTETARQFYDLERLWRDAGRVEIRDE
ncbi:MAG: ribosome silencing factor [Acidobacteriota bacterium]